MNATRLTIDLTRYEMTDRQLWKFQELFRFILEESQVKHTRGNIIVPMDGCGNVGDLKVESWHNLTSEKKNGTHD